MKHLELVGVSKSFGTTRAVREITLSVDRGEILSILGPSGCGKTTTLRMIAGLEIPTAGQIRLSGRDITNTPARHRNMGMVFQNYALFPHLDVFENIAFGLRTRKVSTTEIRKRVDQALESVRLEGYAKRQPHQLSGGQQQRIALARALATQPEVLLLDEPLSNLDPALREDLRDQIRAIIHSLQMTTVFVTHDQQEAFALADRLAILDAGRCKQIGAPTGVYNEPVDAFVAQFLGRANLIPVRQSSKTGSTLRLTLSGGVAVETEAALGSGEAAYVFVRPENITLDNGGHPATIERAVFEGPVVHYTLRAGEDLWSCRTFHRGGTLRRVGESVRFSFPPQQVRVLRDSTPVGQA